MDTLISVLHVATAVFIVGPMAILPMTGLRVLRSRNAAQTRVLAKSTTIFGWLSLLVFVFGFGAMSLAPEKYDLSVTTPWILWSIILYAVAFVLSVFVVVPAMKRAADEAEEVPGDGVAATGKPAGYGLINAVSGIVALLLVAVVVLMVAKP